MKKRYLYITILAAFFSGFSLNAQTVRDSLSFVTSNFLKRNLSSNFNKQLNTFQLNSSLNYFYSGNKFFAGLFQNYQSTLLRTGSQNVRDAENFSVIGEYKLTEAYRFGILTSGEFFTDNRELAINEASEVNSSVYGKISPMDKIKVIPFIGLSLNTQIGRQDKGLLYGGEALVDNINFEDVSINSSVKFQNEDISPRKNALRVFNIGIENNFEEAFSNFISGYYTELRRDFYFESDSLTSRAFGIERNIQGRSEKRYHLSDRILFSPGSGNFNLELSGGSTWRTIDRATRYINLKDISSSSFDTKVEEFRLELGGVSYYRYGIFTGNTKIEYNEREERHIAKRIEGANEIFFREKEEIENRKNNKSQIASISTSGTIRLSSSDLLDFSFYHRKLKYDTPNEQNYDDRDELLSIFRLRYEKRLTPFFDLFANLEGSVKHLVYLYAQRSSNNNIQRVIKLSSGGDYRTKNIISYNSAEVSANYTVYDFEDKSPNLQSFSFRQFTLRDSTVIYFNGRYGVSGSGFLKVSEQGDFSWQNFSGRPVRQLEEIHYEPRLFYKNAFGRFNYYFAAGIRYYSLNTFSFGQDMEKQLQGNYLSIGPLSEIIVSVFTDLQLKFYGWYEFIDSEDNEKKELVNVNFRIMWNF